MIRLWNGTKEETGACELKLTSWNEQPIDQGALSITHVFNKEICVVSELSKVTFFNENGRKITTCSINNDALINEKHEVECIVQLDSNIVLESSDQILVCPEQGRIVYEHLRNEKDDLIYEICSCNYASKDLKVLYKGKDLKTESIGKMDDISQMQLSQDGKKLYTVSELKPQKTVLKCYDVAKSECKWTKEIDANRSIIDVLDFGKLLVLIKDETTGKVEIKEEGAEQKRE